MFITAIILLSFTQMYQRSHGEIDCVDLFAGAARVARATRAVGLKAKALDISYHPNPAVFDINKPAGFLCLGLGSRGKAFQKVAEVFEWSLWCPQVSPAKAGRDCIAGREVRELLGLNGSLLLQLDCGLEGLYR